MDDGNSPCEAHLVGRQTDTLVVLHRLNEVRGQLPHLRSVELAYLPCLLAEHRVGNVVHREDGHARIISRRGRYPAMGGTRLGDSEGKDLRLQVRLSQG